MTAVNIMRLSKAYGGEVQAVRDLTLQIGSKTLTAVLGPSGCGKTTLLRMIAGLLEPTDGDIQFDGASVLGIPPERREVVMVFQKYLLFPYMTVAENVGFGLKMRHEKPREIAHKVSAMLDLVRLSGFEKRKPNELSGGQQQRIALARALVIQPKVLLLDEPLANLDANLRLEMREQILRIQQEVGITTIVVTHDQEEAVFLAETVALMFNGVLRQCGAPREFYDRPADLDVARFFGGVNFIPAERNGHGVRTPLGTLQVTAAVPETKECLLTIRPEWIRLGQEGENAIQARVNSAIYAGSHVRVILDGAGIALHAITEPDTRVAAGDTISVVLPPQHLWPLSVQE